jgi:hypothetical protein
MDDERHNYVILETLVGTMADNYTDRVDYWVKERPDLSVVAHTYRREAGFAGVISRVEIHGHPKPKSDTPVIDSVQKLVASIKANRPRPLKKFFDSINDGKSECKHCPMRN